VAATLCCAPGPAAAVTVDTAHTVPWAHPLKARPAKLMAVPLAIIHLVGAPLPEIGASGTGPGAAATGGASATTAGPSRREVKGRGSGFPGDTPCGRKDGPSGTADLEWRSRGAEGRPGGATVAARQHRHPRAPFAGTLLSCPLRHIVSLLAAQEDRGSGAGCGKEGVTLKAN